MRKHSLLLSCAVVLGCAAPSAMAEFTLLDNFQGSTLGNVNGQNGWTSNTVSSVDAGTVVTDPGDPTNQLLQILTTGANVFKPLGTPLSNSGTGTLYYQIKRSGLVNFSTGASDVAAPTGFGDYESQLNVNSLTIDPQPFRMRDAGAFDPTQESFATGTAYHVWHVIDSTTDTTKLYIQNASAGAPVLQLNGTQSDFVFRNSGTALQTTDLLNFLIKTGGAGTTDTAHIGPLFIDNIYYDATGANLAAPATLISSVVPEPGTFALAGIGAVGLLARRRRRK